jgi:3-oxoacyl-[acyl-carrier protein] reductase
MMMAADEFEGRVALVTGGSRGIGKRIGEVLAAAGAEVVLADLDADGAAAAAEEIRATGAAAGSVAMNVADDESVATSAAGLLDDYGKIAILVNNAGITRDNLLLRMKREEWDGVLQTNLVGVYRLCRALVPAMVKARYGRIVNISSVVGSIGNAGQTNYAAAKAGVEGMTRSLAREVASRNVTVNCVAPGFIDTAMTQALPEKARTMLLDQVPMKRLGTPDDIAAAVRFLAGDAASYITGTTLHVNGGMHM